METDNLQTQNQENQPQEKVHVKEVLEKKPINKNLLIIIALVIIGILPAIGINVYLKYKSKNAQQTEEIINEEKIVQEVVEQKTETVQESPFSNMLQNSNTEILIHSNSEQEYTFEYKKGWYVDSIGALTVVSKEQKDCEASLSGMQSCDMLISSVPYAGTSYAAPGVTIESVPEVGTKEEQIKELASQINSNTPLTEVMFSSFAGYGVVYSQGPTSTYNVFLKGEKNILLLQFTNTASLENIPADLLNISNSIKEI